MRLIGLCGRSGSGKSLFAKTARDNGFYVIDCDEVYKGLVSRRTKCLDDLEKAFGTEVICDNALDRRALSKIVFSNKEKLALLNSITHRHITSEIEKILASRKSENVILDAPTLFESGLDKKCDVIIGIVASDFLCNSRIIARDGITEEQAVSRLNSQKTVDFLVENCDIIIYNEFTPDVFISDSLAVLKELSEAQI